MKKNETANPHPRHHATYWQANVRLIVILLSIWALVSLGGSILFVNFLNRFHIAGLPLGFWLAQQGCVCIFVILIFVYAWSMDILDKKYHVYENNNESIKKKS